MHCSVTESWQPGQYQLLARALLQEHNTCNALLVEKAYQLLSGGPVPATALVESMEEQDYLACRPPSGNALVGGPCFVS